MKRIMGFMLAVTLLLAGFAVQAQSPYGVSDDITVVTRNDPYMAKRLLIKITQPASATANVYKYSIRAK